MGNTFLGVVLGLGPSGCISDGFPTVIPAEGWDPALGTMVCGILVDEIARTVTVGAK